jgi:hypothetical protein
MFGHDMFNSINFTNLVLISVKTNNGEVVETTSPSWSNLKFYLSFLSFS